MLLVMTLPYLLARAFSAPQNSYFNPPASAAFGLGLLFIFTGVGHFVQTIPMAQMLPDWMPHRILLVYLSGLLEFSIAAAFFVPRHRRLAGIAAIGVLILFFPLNIYAAINHIPMGGHAWGPVYLLIRGPLQIAICIWAYWHTARKITDHLGVMQPASVRQH
jgi:uncharacterized membrane protein